MEFDVSIVQKMSDDELKSLTVAVIKERKTVKKRVQKLLKNDGKLMDAWLQNLSLDPPKALPEEIDRIRAERRENLEKMMMSNPDAFVAHQTSTFLLKLLNEVRDERLKRMPEKKSK
jgi:hypothetical protein